MKRRSKIEKREEKKGWKWKWDFAYRDFDYNQLANRHNTRLFVFHAPQQFSHSEARNRPPALFHVAVRWHPVPLLFCHTFKFTLKLFSILLSKYSIFLVFFNFQLSHLTKATPLGNPVNLSFKIFFCTILPNLLNISSICFSVMFLKRKQIL